MGRFDAIYTPEAKRQPNWIQDAGRGIGAAGDTVIQHQQRGAEAAHRKKGYEYQEGQLEHMTRQRQMAKLAQKVSERKQKLAEDEFEWDKNKKEKKVKEFIGSFLVD